MSEKVKWILEVDTSTGQTNIKKFSTTIDKSTTSIKKQDAAAGKATGTFGKMKGALLAIGGTAVIYGMSRLVKKFIELSIAQEQAEMSLKAALIASEEFTEAAYQGHLKFASAMQEVTTSGDEEVLMLMALMKNLGVTSDQLQGAAKQAIGLAGATGRSASTMAMYIALAQQGETTMLRRYIPALRKATDAQDEMRIIQEFTARGFKVAEMLAKTFGGRLTQLKNVWGDLYEVTGDAFVKNQAIINLLDKGKLVVKEMGDQVKRWVEANGELIAQNVEGTIKSIYENIKDIYELYKRLPTGMIGAAGTGLIAGILYGGPAGAAVASYMLLRAQMKGTVWYLDKVKKEAEMAAAAMDLVAERSGFFGGGSAGKSSGGGRSFAEPEGETEVKPPPSSKDDDKLYKGLEVFKEIEDLKRLYMEENLDLMLKGVDEYYVLKLHKDQAAAAREKEMQETRIGMYQTSAGNIASTFLQISQAGGKQSADAFKMYKAFAIIQAGMAARVAVVGALGSPPYGYGAMILAGTIGTMAAVQIALLAKAAPPSYDQGGISNAKGTYQTGSIQEAHVPIPSGRIPVVLPNGGGTKEINVILQNPVFQDLDTQRQAMQVIASEITMQLAPNAVVKNYEDDGQIRSIFKGRL